MSQAPCYQCADRTVKPDCHMTCERYLAYKEQNEKERALMRKEGRANSDAWFITQKRRRKFNK